MLGRGVGRLVVVVGGAGHGVIDMLLLRCVVELGQRRRLDPVFNTVCIVMRHVAVPSRQREFKAVQARRDPIKLVQSVLRRRTVRAIEQDRGGRDAAGPMTGGGESACRRRFSQQGRGEREAQSFGRALEKGRWLKEMRGVGLANPQPLRQISHAAGQG